MVEYKSNPPDANSLMATARSFGNYDLAGALADLIDNSIVARASRVDINCHLNHDRPEVRIRDDGCGMSEAELHQAMRPASSNPANERSPDDLGRFGWGMKSASFSQCKKLTVISSKNRMISGALWDLDNIDEWTMGVLGQEEANLLLSRSFDEASGTELIWENCDRLSEDGALSQDNFNELIVYARNKLSLIFHRFINPEKGSRKLSIFLNKIEIDEYDPFHQLHLATQPLEPEVVTLSGGEKIGFQAYVLPHYSKLEKSEYERLGGEEGYVKNQGFYVYRNKRLIIYGTWFRLAKHGELSKLVRVRVDIPTSLDSMWKITVDKSDAQLPSTLRIRLKDLIENFKAPSTRLIRSRGGSIDKPGHIGLWKRHVKDNQIRFSINREYPLVSNFVDRLEPDKKAEFIAIIDLIEQGVPVDTILSDASSRPQDMNQSLSNPGDFSKLLEATVPQLLAAAKGDVGALIEQLKVMEPYRSNYNFVENYLSEIGIL